MHKQQPKDRLAPLIDPRKLCYQSIELDGSVLLSEMTRLVDAVDIDASTCSDYNHENNGKYLTAPPVCHAVLKFERDIERHLTIIGHAEATVIVECQRCLTPMPLQLEIDISLGIVWTEETANNLPSHLDPLIIGEGKVSIAGLIEEEFLLALPFVNYHSEGKCQQDSLVNKMEDEALVTERDNPFAVLGKLKGKPSKE